MSEFLQILMQDSPSKNVALTSRANLGKEKDVKFIGSHLDKRRTLPRRKEKDSGKKEKAMENAN